MNDKDLRKLKATKNSARYRYHKELKEEENESIIMRQPTQELYSDRVT